MITAVVVNRPRTRGARGGGGQTRQAQNSDLYSLTSITSQCSRLALQRKHLLPIDRSYRHLTNKLVCLPYLSTCRKNARPRPTPLCAPSSNPGMSARTIPFPLKPSAPGSHTPERKEQRGYRSRERRSGHSWYSNSDGVGNAGKQVSMSGKFKSRSASLKGMIAG